MSDNSTVHRFNALEFWLVIGLAFGLATVTSLLALGGAVVGQPTAAGSFARDSLGGVLKSELIVACFLIAVLRRSGWRLHDFNFFPSWRTTLLGTIVATVVICAFWLLALFAQPFLGNASGSALRLPALGQIETAGALLVLAASIVDPLYEELLVCAYVIETLRGRFGALFAINASVAIRVAFHAYQGPTALLQFAALGLLFAYCYSRWRNVWPLVVAHGLLDFIGLLTVQAN
jgi:membrane protease YdiL (CAAX protease family)